MTDDPIRQALTHYRKKRQSLIDEIAPKLDEIARIDERIHGLAADLGESPDIQPLNVTPSAGANKSDGSNPTRYGASTVAIEPDDFVDMTQTEAARAYLKRTGGRAMLLTDLVDALRAGGAKVGGTDPSRTLYVSLKANPKKEFKWIGADRVGLTEYYKKKQK